MGRRLGALIGTTGLAILLLAQPAAAAANTYDVHRLVSDGKVSAQKHDTNLVNAWGLSAGPSTPWWVADNGTDKSTLYDNTGAAVPLVVGVGGGPTGTVYNATSDFPVKHAGQSGPSLFLFASEDGQIRGWNPSVPSNSMSAFVIAGDAAHSAVFKGLAISSVRGANFLYATDFHNGRVDVFNGKDKMQHWAGAFHDPRIPAGYAPFGIQAIGRSIFVTYAKQDAQRHDETDGAHLGFIDQYGADGHWMARVASRFSLNAPWGIAWAPRNFGHFSGDLLVGNFGNGRIHAFASTRSGWERAGVLKDASGNPIVIDGLWGIAFGNGAAAGPRNTLYFAAGPNHEADGLFGSITVHQ
jgi:uncharacterized protein (TIGR03118 family)